MELHKIAIRVLFAYIFLLLIIRLSGKRTVAEGNTFDFVLALILGDTVDNAMWGEVPIAQFIVAAGTLVVIQLLVSAASYRNETLQAILEGSPTTFLRKGRLVREGLRRERISRRESEEMMRLGGGMEPDEWASVEAARLEHSGEPSVILRPWARPAQGQDRDALRRRRGT